MAPPRQSRRGVLRSTGAVLAAGVLPTGAAVAQDPYFFVRSIDPERVTVDLGEVFDLSATILNTGVDGTQSVEYRVDDANVRREEVTLASAEEGTVRFENVDTERFGSGSSTHGVYTDDTSKTGQLLIRDRPVFELSDVGPRLGEAAPGGELTITATVSNTGGASGHQTVRVLVDGQQRQSELVPLTRGESRELSFTVGVPEAEGEYSYAVETDDDRATGALSVAAPSEGGGGLGGGLLLALGGGGALTLYGAYTLLSRRRGEPSGADDAEEPPPAGPQVTGGRDDGTVVAAVIDDHLERVDRAVTDAQRHRDEGRHEQALAACERAREAAAEAGEAAGEYAPDRIDEIESVRQRVERIETAVEQERGDGAAGGE